MDASKVERDSRDLRFLTLVGTPLPYDEVGAELFQKLEIYNIDTAGNLQGLWFSEKCWSRFFLPQYA